MDISSLSVFRSSRLRVFAFATLILGGCATNELSSQGSHVRTDLAPPSAVGYDPAQCQALGPVVGKGGGSFGGAWISNEQLLDYAMNDLRNKSASMGGNFVQYAAPQFGTSGADGSSNVSSAMVTGTVFRCKTGPAGLKAVAPPPAVVVAKAPDGERTISVALQFPSLRMLLAFDTRKSTTIDWHILGTRATKLSPECQSLLLVDGELKEMDALPPVASELVFAVPFDTLQAASNATKVKGRICDNDWYFSERQAAAVKDFVAQVKEELLFRSAKKVTKKGS